MTAQQTKKKASESYTKAYSELRTQTERVIELRVSQMTAKDSEINHIAKDEANLKSKRHDLRNSITKKDAAMRARIHLAREFRKARNEAKAQLQEVESKLSDLDTKRAQAHERIVAEAKAAIAAETSKILGTEVTPAA